MSVTTATATVDREGDLIAIVRQFVGAQETATAGGVKSPEDYDAMGEFVAVDEFKRVGAYLEELDWRSYLKFLAGWGEGTRFEFTEFHITEAGNAVFQEIEERHYRGDEFIRKNVIAVYRFNADNKINHLDIYEQATDSGQWIAKAANRATS
ncbi:MAG: hypothetical protein R3E09_13455 [Novosphingobium sp.]